MSFRAPRTVIATLALSAASLGAQGGAPVAPPAAEAPAPLVQLKNPVCDCAMGDGGRELRNLAAFAPLGFIGALAATGAPALFVARTPAGVVPASASRTVATLDPVTLPELEIATAEAGRGAPKITETFADIPADSLTEAGLRAPDTATPLPSVLLLGSGLVAIGALTLARTRG